MTARKGHIAEFPPTDLSPAELRFKQEVADYLDERLPVGGYRRSLGIAALVDAKFSADLGARGLIGMYLPAEYGGSGKTAVDRLVVAEELLARGAPVGYHWIADRQMGPSILANGTDAQRGEFLPRIASGELSFSIGMSEPDAGSDLAALRTKAVRDGDDWVVSGSKIWTSGAATATHVLAAVRTGPGKRDGITQFIIDLHRPGVRVAPIEFIDGTRDFCEVHFDDMRVPDDCRLGAVGQGWTQNTGELALERGGVDRWMSLMPLLDEWSGRCDRSDRAAMEYLSAVCWGLRGLSLSIARQVDSGHSPVVEAALVKELGTTFEQECLRFLSDAFGGTPKPDAADEYEALLAKALLIAPSWTIRGGTNEVLRTIVAKDIRS
ncbi:acyl-CoA dehydrogenase family protein [Amycolatopsis sp. GM8]|uniref:acyl-CoA dehydrogenase family protein n=1 Tax=Amycolatopsis sp. GM8 TaxID=2896530 RepID=UPI001F492ACC|nr:acyl-CoA dehydrogenase family protein [Amycolatopsis sp. GM8]